MSSAFLQVSFYFLAVKIWVSSLNDAIFHKKGCAARYEWGSHRGSSVLCITAAGCGAGNVYTRSGDVWLGK